MDKRLLSERDICTKFITPAIQGAGWQSHQFREEVKLTDGRVIVRGTVAARVQNPDVKGGPKRADYVLYAVPNVPIAVVEAKRNQYAVGHGMQQALAYAEMLDAPFALSSNGDGFLLHDRTGLTQPAERELALDAFPRHDELWAFYRQWKGLSAPEAVRLVEQPYHSDGSGKEPRYYQRVAINRAVEAVAKGQDRILLVMATGTGKTYTAFQIIWRLWKAKLKKRILRSRRPRAPARGGEDRQTEGEGRPVPPAGEGRAGRRRPALLAHLQPRPQEPQRARRGEPRPGRAAGEVQEGAGGGRRGTSRQRRRG